MRGYTSIVHWLLLLFLAAPLQAGFPKKLHKELAALDGSPVSLSSYKDKVVLVYFWTTYCGPCKEAKPLLEELKAKYADRGLVVLAVDNGEGAALVRKHLEGKKTGLTNLLDEKKQLSRALMLRGEPSFALFDTNERLVWSSTALGPDTMKDLDWRLNRVLPGGPGSVPVGKLKP